MDAKRMRQLESGAIPSGIVDGERVEIRGPNGIDRWFITKGRRVDTVARSKVSDVRDRWDAMRFWEAATSEDHFYGAWKGGSKAAGGRASSTGTHKPGLSATDALVKGQKGEHPWKPDEAESRAALRAELLHAPGVKPEDRQWEGKPDSLSMVQTKFPWLSDPDAGMDKYVYRGPDGTPVGWVAIQRLPGVKPTHIESVSVFASERGKGYATKMYDKIQDTTSVNLYDIIGKSGEFTPDGKAFAAAWLRHRIEVEGE